MPSAESKSPDLKFTENGRHICEHIVHGLLAASSITRLGGNFRSNETAEIYDELLDVIAVSKPSLAPSRDTVGNYGWRRKCSKACEAGTVFFPSPWLNSVRRNFSHKIPFMFFSRKNSPTIRKGYASLTQIPKLARSQ